MRKGMWVVGLCALLCMLPCVSSAQEFDPEHPTAGSGTLQLNGTETDWVTGGKTYSATPADGAWSAITGDSDQDGRPDFVRLSFFADEDANVATTGFNWSLEFSVNQIPGAALVVGTYADAQRSAFAEPGHPGIDVTGNGHGCNTQAGEFEITAFEYDCIDDGLLTTTFHVRQFAAKFKQHCEAGVSFLTGTIAYTAPATGFSCPGSPDDGGGDGDSPEPPPPPPYQVAFDPEIWSMGMEAANDSAHTVPFQIYTDETFNSDLSLSVVTNASPNDGIEVSIEPSFVPAPGSGVGTVNVKVGPNTRPRPYTVTVLADDGQGQVRPASFLVNVVCTPVFVLGIDQPTFTTIGPNRELEVKASGSGPFQYQWYRGVRGMTHDPIPSTGPNLTVPNDSARYWVRVRNACGSFDSEVAMPRTP